MLAHPCSSVLPRSCILENQVFPPPPRLSQRSSPSRMRSAAPEQRRVLDRCGPLQGAPLGRKCKNKKTSPSFLRRQRPLLVLCPGRFPPKNIAPGSPTNDDPQLGRPLAFPILSVFIAPPAESSTRVGVISRHKPHQRSAASGLLPWPAAELPGRGSAKSGAADRHPRTTAVVGGARSR